MGRNIHSTSSANKRPSRVSFADACVVCLCYSLSQTNNTTNKRICNFHCYRRTANSSLVCLYICSNGRQCDRRIHYLSDSAADNAGCRPRRTFLLSFRSFVPWLLSGFHICSSFIQKKRRRQWLPEDVPLVDDTFTRCCSVNLFYCRNQNRTLLLAGILPDYLPWCIFNVFDCLSLDEMESLDNLVAGYFRYNLVSSIPLATTAAYKYR